MDIIAKDRFFNVDFFFILDNGIYSVFSIREGNIKTELLKKKTNKVIIKNYWTNKLGFSL